MTMEVDHVLYFLRFGEIHDELFDFDCLGG